MVREFSTEQVAVDECRCKNTVFVERNRIKEVVFGECRSYRNDEIHDPLTGCPGKAVKLQ